MEVGRLNLEFQSKSPQEIIKWCVAQGTKMIVTTHFGPLEAVILHMACKIKADIKVVWIDSGYNTKASYCFAQNLIETLSLQVEVFTPMISAARQDAVLGGVPFYTEPEHAVFTENFKLEPFRRAMATLQPDIWLTALRRDQTEFRQSLDIFTQDEEISLKKFPLKKGPLKVAPFFYWSEEQMQAYLIEHKLPNEENYYDPTKVLANRECGLHTGLNK